MLASRLFGVKCCVTDFPATVCLHWIISSELPPVVAFTHTYAQRTHLRRRSFFNRGKSLFLFSRSFSLLRFQVRRVGWWWREVGRERNFLVSEVCYQQHFMSLWVEGGSPFSLLPSFLVKKKKCLHLWMQIVKDIKRHTQKQKERLKEIRKCDACEWKQNTLYNREGSQMLDPPTARIDQSTRMWCESGNMQMPASFAHILFFVREFQLSSPLFHEKLEENLQRRLLTDNSVNKQMHTFSTVFRYTSLAIV